MAAAEGSCSPAPPWVHLAYLFGWPGLGNVVLHAALHRDYPLVTSAFLLISIAVVFCNAAADAVCAWLDPRVRLA